MSHSDLVHGRLTTVPAPLALRALTGRWSMAAPKEFSSDIEVLNYALTLEHLESAYYRQGNAAGLLEGAEQAYLVRIQADEEAHVAALTGIIRDRGGVPVEAPDVDFWDSFANRKSYLTTSHTFENVGAGAYLGAAGFIEDKQILQAAAAIYGVEARHAALVGHLLGLPPEGGVYLGAFETPVDPSTVLAQLAPFFSQLDRTPVGAPGAGGGAAAARDTSGLMMGGAAALGAAGLAAFVAHRDRQRPPSTAD